MVKICLCRLKGNKLTDHNCNSLSKFLEALSSLLTKLIHWIRKKLRRALILWSASVWKRRLDRKSSTITRKRSMLSSKLKWMRDADMRKIREPWSRLKLKLRNPRWNKTLECVNKTDKEVYKKWSSAHAKSLLVFCVLMSQLKTCLSKRFQKPWKGCQFQEAFSKRKTKMTNFWERIHRGMMRWWNSDGMN